MRIHQCDISQTCSSILPRRVLRTHASPCVARDSRFTIRDSPRVECTLSWALLPAYRASTRASCRADGRPYTGPSILTCAHLAGVDPASGRWEDLFLPGSPRDRSALLLRFPIVSPSTSLACHALTFPYTCRSLSGFSYRFYNKAFNSAETIYC